MKSNGVTLVATGPATALLVPAVFALLLAGWVQVDQEEREEPAAAECPPFIVKTFDGASINRGTLEGKVVLLEFWDTRCGPCIRLMPKFEELQAMYASDPGIEFIQVNAGWQTFEEAKAFVERKPRRTRFGYMEKKYSERLQVNELPTTVILDKNFRIAYRHVGVEEGEDEALLLEIEGRLLDLIEEPASENAVSELSQVSLPEQTFDHLWKTLDERYALFEAKGMRLGCAVPNLPAADRAEHDRR